METIDNPQTPKPPRRRPVRPGIGGGAALGTGSCTAAHHRPQKTHTRNSSIGVVLVIATVIVMGTV